jgi:hypothetical protein
MSASRCPHPKACAAMTAGCMSADKCGGIDGDTITIHAPPPAVPESIRGPRNRAERRAGNSGRTMSLREAMNKAQRSRRRGR